MSPPLWNSSLSIDWRNTGTRVGVVVWYRFPGRSSVLSWLEEWLRNPDFVQGSAIMISTCFLVLSKMNNHCTGWKGRVNTYTQGLGLYLLWMKGNQIYTWDWTDLWNPGLVNSADTPFPSAICYRNRISITAPPPHKFPHIDEQRNTYFQLTSKVRL